MAPLCHIAANLKHYLHSCCTPAEANGKTAPSAYNVADLEYDSFAKGVLMRYRFRPLWKNEK